MAITSQDSWLRDYAGLDIGYGKPGRFGGLILDGTGTFCGPWQRLCLTAFSVKAAERRYAECSRAIGTAEPSDSDAEAGRKLVDALFKRNQELEVPSPKKLGIDEERYFSLIRTMAKQALASGSPQNNPRIPASEEIEEIYRQTWS